MQVLHFDLTSTETC